MAATLYPRINPVDVNDARTGTASAPLRIPGIPGYSPFVDDFIITRAMADLAAAASVVVVPGAAVPAAPAGMIPFRVEFAGPTIHLRIAFIADPTLASPALVVPPDLQLTVVPDVEITVAQPLTLTGSTLAFSHDFLSLSAPVATKNVEVRTGTATYAQVSGTAFAGNVLTLTIQFIGPNPSGAINANWFLVVKSASDVWLTLAVSESAADPATITQKPWIHVPAASANFNLGGPFVPGVKTPAGSVLNVRNYGTGSLDIGASITMDGADQVHVVATSIPASGGGNVPLEYTAGDGVGALPVLFTTNDSAIVAGGYHDATVFVSATAEAIGVADTILVLDASGSMSLKPNGLGFGNPASPAPADRRRWDNLAVAVAHMVDGYINFLNVDAPTSRLGVAVFPDVLNKTPGWPSRAATLVSAVPVTTAGLAATITTQLNAAGAALEGAGLTPIGEGLEVAMGNAAGSGMFAAAMDAHRRWLVLMTDGAHNAGDTNPREFYLPDAMPDFDDKEVRVFSIAYSTETSGAAVDLMQDLAENGLNPVVAGVGESRYAQAQTIVGFEKDLTDTFLDAMATTVGLDPTYDPVGTLTANQPLAIHEFHVSPYDTGVGLFIDWETQSTDRVQIALISPRCERFEARDLEKLPGFEFRTLPGYAHAFISGAALKGDASQPSRYGTWKLELRMQGDIIIEIGRKPGVAPNPAAAAKPATGGKGTTVSTAVNATFDTETYKFSVFHRSSLRMDARTTSPRHITGEPIELVARLQAAGVPVQGARVVATVNAPSTDYGTTLAQFPLKSFDKDGPAEHAGTWAAKALAIAQQFGPLETSQTTYQVVLEEFEPGVYGASLENTVNAGVYTMHVVASGSAAEVPYRRERALTARIEATPDAHHTTVRYALGERGEIVVHVGPRDRHDRVVIFDPKQSPRLGIEIKIAHPTGDVINNFDGTYSRTFTLTASGHPELVLTWDGEPFLVQAVPGLTNLYWMDTVRSYEPVNLGEDAKFKDPTKALGPVKGPKDPFVSLGGGRIVLGVTKGHLCTRLGHFSASHLAVFTDAARFVPYRVLVLPARSKCWVTIGDGAGPVETFEVSSRIGQIQAVMVQDLGRGRGGSVRLQGLGYQLWRSGHHPKPPKKKQPSHHAEPTTSGRPRR